MWSSWPCVMTIPRMRSLFFSTNVKSGITASMPGISSSGKARPQSTITMSFSHSNSVKFLPISFKPPRKYARTEGFCFVRLPLPLLFFVCVLFVVLAGAFSPFGADFTVFVVFLCASVFCAVRVRFGFASFVSLTVCCAASSFTCAFSVLRVFWRLTGFSMGPEILPMKLSPAPLRGWSCCFAGASPSDVNFVIFLILFSAKLTFLSNNTGALSQFTQK